MDKKILISTIAALTASGKGILAADESENTIKKRFAAVKVASTEENRRAYRDMLLTTPDIAQYISGVILFEETLYQKNLAGKLFPDFLKEQGIVSGIKVDKGFLPLPNFDGDSITEGLDGLAKLLEKHKQAGARFAKWRAVISITPQNPSRVAIKSNAEVLARYAAICQNLDIVPIVEPEVLIDGDHTISRSAEVSHSVLHSVFHALNRHKVILEYMLLKPSMVISGKQCAKQASVDEVAEATLRVLLETVPAAVPSINFLSGGQTPEDATAHLNAMNVLKPNKPWNLSFSYARALQEYALTAWAGKPENVIKAQQAFIKRAELNSLAVLGKYQVAMETTKIK
ncbi:MAG: class I fructose-bisphosphate aldolase [Gammaproteobacteria bacterium]